jgi:hypothetical protein
MKNEFCNNFEKVINEKKGCNVSINGYDKLKKISKLNVIKIIK